MPERLEPGFRPTWEQEYLTRVLKLPSKARDLLWFYRMTHDKATGLIPGTIKTAEMTGIHRATVNLHKRLLRRARFLMVCKHKRYFLAPYFYYQGQNPPWAKNSMGLKLGPCEKAHWYGAKTSPRDGPKTSSMDGAKISPADKLKSGHRYLDKENKKDEPWSSTNDIQKAEQEGRLCINCVHFPAVTLPGAEKFKAVEKCAKGHPCLARSPMFSAHCPDFTRKEQSP